MAHLDSQVAKRLSPSRSITGITTEVGVEVGPVLAALPCSRMSAVSLTDVCRLRRRGRPLVPAVRRPTGRRTLPAHSGGSTLTALQDRHRGRRRGLARIAARTRVRLGAITRRPYERSIVHESSLGPRSRRLALSVVLPGWKRLGLRMRAARVDWEDQRRRKVVKKILPKRRVNRAAFRRAWGQVG